MLLYVGLYTLLFVEGVRNLSETEKRVECAEHLLESTMEMWGAMVGMIIKGIVEKYGDEGRKIIKDAVFKACRWQTKKTLGKSGITQKGTKALADFGYPDVTQSREIGDHGVFDYKRVKLDDKNFAIKVTRCPYLKTWKALNILESVPDLCDLLTHGDEGVSSVFNPKLRLTLPKCMSKGDAYCIYWWKEIDQTSSKKKAKGKTNDASTTERKIL
jgi:hypothetical protein